jgi:hypothetical protein
MGSRRSYHFRKHVMSLQLAAFATVRGIVQKTLVAHVNLQDPSAPLFVTREGDITLSVHF